MGNWAYSIIWKFFGIFCVFHQAQSNGHAWINCPCISWRYVECGNTGDPFGHIVFHEIIKGYVLNKSTAHGELCSNVVSDHILLTICFLEIFDEDMEIVIQVALSAKTEITNATNLPDYHVSISEQLALA